MTMTVIFGRARTPVFLCAAFVLSACSAVGPNHQPPAVKAPPDWSAWTSASRELPRAAGTKGAPERTWWRAFQDPILDQLQVRLREENPDLKTAMLHYEQARSQRNLTVGRQYPDLKLQGSAARQRQSEYAAGDRILDTIAPNSRDSIAKSLSEPYVSYQGGVDASWEIDLWGRIRRAVEGAEAEVAASAALLDQTRLLIASDLAQAYVDLRTTQRLLKLTRDDIVTLRERTALMKSRHKHGLGNDLDVERQKAQLADLEAQIPPLLEQEAQAKNSICALLGLHPGELTLELGAERASTSTPLPEYKLGLPSDLAGRRPDIRTAEARLHQATAAIGEAQAQLYPSIRLGARAGFDSYTAGHFGDWGSRAWSIGPTLDLPVFDGGRRRATVTLRELRQQEAAVEFQRIVLKAWQEIDDALTAYAAEQERQQRLLAKARSSADVYQLAQARERAGLADFLNVIDAQRADIQARRDVVASQGRTQLRYIAIYRALGGGMAEASN
jgi:NodT family efflux transporter outer membrane factor (OMF) lipoprotein